MIARRFTYEFWQDMNALNVEWPKSEPRASEYIAEMIEFIKGLIANGMLMLLTAMFISMLLHCRNMDNSPDRILRHDGGSQRTSNSTK